MITMGGPLVALTRFGGKITPSDCVIAPFAKRPPFL